MESSQEIKKQEESDNSKDLLIDHANLNTTGPQVLKPAVVKPDPAEENKLVERNATTTGSQTLSSSCSQGPHPPIDTASSKNLADGMDVDEDDEKDKDDDGSELSDGEDLRQDLEDALDNSSFSFTGNVYHANILTTAPNPCLNISGLGLVGLPLSERDAKAIVSNATLSPFGHGERTVVNKDVRDTWEIEPDRLSFGNPDWLKYIDGVVCLEVCRALGVAIGTPPKMELYKLLLYERGSHFLPHRDTQKANGMFATVVIVLPAAYTGGQVVVSHASSTKTIDFSSNSLLSTAVLAWYTDVQHEVKPITTGYRLALTYNLIHTAAPGVPRPSLPEMGDSVDKLRQILRKWRAGKYQEEPEMPLLAYLLRHEYSSQNLKDGSKALKGVDAHLVTFLREITEELGYMVGLATLERHVSGPGDDSGGGYYQRQRHYYSDSEDEDDHDAAEMLEVTETTNSIVGLVNLNGVSLLPFGKIGLEDDNIVPSDPFEDEEPDKVEYEGYMGNYAGDVTHWYHRTVLVLMHEDDVDNVCFSVAGMPYAFGKLAALGPENSLSPSAETKLWVDRILSKTNHLSKDQALRMLGIAMKWKDAEMFKAIMGSPVCTLSVVTMDVLSSAWKIFSFEAVRVCFEQALARSPAFAEKMKLIYSVRSKMTKEDKPVVRPWCNTQATKILASYTQPDIKDIPIIMHHIRHSGWSSFLKILFPTILKRPSTYAFLIALIKALQAARQSLLDQLAKVKASKSSTSTETETESPPDAAATEEGVANASQEEDGKNLVDKVIEKALEAAAKQWSHATASYASYTFGHYATHSQNTQVAQTGKVDRIVEIIDQAILSSNLQICRTLFIDILKNTGTMSEKFTQIYNPLIPRLRTLLQSKNVDLTAPPFVDLFQILIGAYLRDVLGQKGQHLNARLRKIGCGCQDCEPLDKFIMDPTTQTTLIRLIQKRRLHLEGRISSASDLCTYQTVKWGSPHGVQVTKRPEVVQASTWVHRQNAARTFLSSVGTDVVIKKIMGARYADVVAALDGTTPFGTTTKVVAGGDRRVSNSNSGLSATATSKVTADGPTAVGDAAAPLRAGSSGSGTASGSGVNRNVMASSSQAPRATLASTAPPPPQVAGKKRKDLGHIDLT